MQRSAFRVGVLCARAACAGVMHSGRTACAVGAGAAAGQDRGRRRPRRRGRGAGIASVGCRRTQPGHRSAGSAGRARPSLRAAVDSRSKRPVLLACRLAPYRGTGIGTSPPLLPPRVAASMSGCAGRGVWKADRRMPGLTAERSTSSARPQHVACGKMTACCDRCSGHALTRQKLTSRLADAYTGIRLLGRGRRPDVRSPQ